MAGEGQLAREVRARLEIESAHAGSGEPLSLVEGRVVDGHGVEGHSVEGHSAQVEEKKVSGMPKRSEDGGFAAKLEERSYGKTKRQHIKEFGCLFGIICAAIAGYKFYTGDIQPGLIALAVTTFFIGTGYLAPLVLYPLWAGWMAFAHFLGIIMSFVFVSVTWFVIAVPLAILLKVIGKKVMDLSFDRSVESYWEDREEKYHDFKLLERQF
ncbi:SxtJ family membrane protein [bacterium]|nr:SxtJ family membrane protein [bacterium]